MAGRKFSAVLHLCTSGGRSVANVAEAVGAPFFVLHLWGTGRQVSRMICQGPVRVGRQGCVPYLGCLSDWL